MKSDKALQLAGLIPDTKTLPDRAYAGHGFHDSGRTSDDPDQITELHEAIEATYTDTGCAMEESPHTHRFYELVYCQSNSGSEYLVGSTRHRLQRGDIVLIPPNVVHAAVIPESRTEPFRGYTLRISSYCVDLLCNAYPFFRQFDSSKGHVLHTAGTVWEHLNSLFRESVVECEARNPGWDSATMGIVTLLLTLIVRISLITSESAVDEKKPELLEQILDYVENFMSEKITLEDVARRFWVSQSTVTHLFNNKMGVSFYKYVTKRRLVEAKNLIHENLPMEKIATKVGFTDYSAFYRAFKREFGISPQQFRKLSVDP